MKKKKKCWSNKIEIHIEIENQRESGPILKAMLYMEVRDVFVLGCPIVLSLLNPRGGRVFWTNEKSIPKQEKPLK